MHPQQSSFYNDKALGQAEATTRIELEQEGLG